MIDCIDTNIEIGLEPSIGINSETSVVESALKLYKLGLNVFPVPSPYEVQALISEKKFDEKEENATEKFWKPPYLLHVVFNNRLHVCGDACEKRHAKTGGSCLPEHAKFENLFVDCKMGYRSNIACMLGRTSGNLLVIDCDSQSSFTENLAIVKERNIPHWAYTSYRGGGILVRILEGEAKNMPKCKKPDVEIYGNHHFAVLPPSTHPSGVLYTWVSNNPISCQNSSPLIPVSVKELDWLEVELLHSHNNNDSSVYNTQKIDLSGYPEWLSKLSLANQEFVTKGVGIYERNKRLFSAACDMAGNQIDYESAETLLLEGCEKCHPPYPENEAMETIRSAYSTDREPACSVQKSYKNWQIAEKFFEMFDWKQMGRKWKSDQSVFLAAIERAKKENRPYFRCSCREIAELSNLHIETAVSSLRRLSGRDKAVPYDKVPPLLTLDHRDRRSKVAYYRFSDMVLSVTFSEQYSSLEDSSVRNMYIPNPLTDAEKDVFKKIGVLGWKIWNYLIENPNKKQSEIAASLNIPAYSVRRVLLETCPLIEFGFVTKIVSEKSYSGNCLTQDTLEVIASELGTSGKTKETKLRFQRDRELRANLKIGEIREIWLDRRWRWEQKQEENTRL